jgi:hypothetical protein
LDRIPPDEYKETLLQLTYSHKCALEGCPWDERPYGYAEFREAHIHLSTDDLHALKEHYKKQVETIQWPESFAALQAQYNSSTWYFDEIDGDMRTWRELSPEGKLSYITRDAVVDGVSFERFAKAVEEALADVPPAAREQAALRLLLHSERDLLAVDRLLPSEDCGHDLFAPGRPVAERLEDAILLGAANRQSVLGYDLPERVGEARQSGLQQLRLEAEASPSPAPTQTRGRGR